MKIQPISNQEVSKMLTFIIAWEFGRRTTLLARARRRKKTMISLIDNPGGKKNCKMVNAGPKIP